MDAPVARLGTKHRKERHDESSALFLYRRSGDPGAYWSARMHIATDFSPPGKKLPHLIQSERGRSIVNQQLKDLYHSMVSAQLVSGSEREKDRKALRIVLVKNVERQMDKLSGLSYTAYHREARRLVHLREKYVRGLTPSDLMRWDEMESLR